MHAETRNRGGVKRRGRAQPDEREVLGVGQILVVPGGAVVVRVVLGLDIPLNLMAGDEQVNKATPPAALFPGQWATTALDSQTLGFLALHAKLKITRIESGPLDASAFELPLGLTRDPRSAGGEKP